MVDFIPPISALVAVAGTNVNLVVKVHGCRIGVAELVERLPPVLEDWGIRRSRVRPWTLDIAIF